MADLIEEIDIYKASQKKEYSEWGCGVYNVIKEYDSREGMIALANKLNEVIQAINKLNGYSDETK